jgi:glutamyl/glutaminyl-tRNA synthetase
VRVYSELPDKMRFLFQDGVALDEAARRNLDKEPGARGWLRAYAEHLHAARLPPSYPASRGTCDAAVRLPVSKYEPHEAPTGLPCATPVDLEHDARMFAERLGVKFGAFVHPVRAALTGTTAGFGLFDTLFLLGREQALARLRAAAG